MSSITLTPRAGFCIKTRVLHAGQQRSEDGSAQGRKVFVNIAWDGKVPPPSPESEAGIDRALRGGSDDDDWFVPVVVSDARQDTDKSGQPSLVFDCVFSSSLKSRSITDAQFKLLLVELALQRIETQASLVLAREISTPNIASKGSIPSRTVLVPPPIRPHQLVQDITPDSDTRPKNGLAISKTPSSASLPSNVQIPAWSWTKADSHIRIIIDVPGLSHADVPASTLDIEPRRLLLIIPRRYELTIDLDRSDAELSDTFAPCHSADSALTLKRVAQLDVDNASAEWRVVDRVIIVNC